MLITTVSCSSPPPVIVTGHLHNAAELFLKVGMVENAQRVKATTDKVLTIYAANPGVTSRGWLEDRRGRHGKRVC